MVTKRKLEDDFEKIATIGRGSYGVVYKVRMRATGKIVALKRVKMDRNPVTSEEGIPSSSLREIAALRNLQHPNILQMHEVIHTGSSLYLLFEYLDNDLKRALNQTYSGLSIRVSKSFMYQLLQAISFCHSRRILHRDLKLQNILVNNDGTVKLADFGLARGMSMPLRVYTKEVVTLWYRAPELLLGSDIYGPAVDIWSLGGIFYEMLTKKVLFPGDSEIDQLFKIFRVLGTPDESQWDDVNKLPHYKTNFPHWPKQNLINLLGAGSLAGDLLTKILVYDPLKRISAQDALKHQFFDDSTRRPTLKDIQDPSLELNSKM